MIFCNFHCTKVITVPIASLWLKRAQHSTQHQSHTQTHSQVHANARDRNRDIRFCSRHFPLQWQHSKLDKELNVPVKSGVNCGTDSQQTSERASKQTLSKSWYKYTHRWYAFAHARARSHQHVKTDENCESES